MLLSFFYPLDLNIRCAKSSTQKKKEGEGDTEQDSTSKLENMSFVQGVRSHAKFSPKTASSSLPLCQLSWSSEWARALALALALALARAQAPELAWFFR